MTLQDKSNYLKAMLILVGKDKKIVAIERENLLRLADFLGFGREFCDTVMNEYFENDYLVHDPPKFSTIEVAKAFILDGVRLAVADKELHLFELNWLKSIADINGVDNSWGFEQFEQSQTSTQKDKTIKAFAVESLIS